MLNINPKNIKYYQPKKFVSDMVTRGGLAPIILLEAFVTGGRTYHAYKRDGFVEARERFTEETLGALFWFSGVKMFNKMGDMIGKSILKLPEIDFDGVKDHARNPINNFMAKMKQAAQEGKAGKVSKNTLTIFKASKVATSVLLANALVGFVVPKVNQKITKKYQESIKKIRNDKFFKHGENMDNFVQKDRKQDKNGKNINFKGGDWTQTVLNLTNNFEHKPTYQLLSTDIGVAGGRAISARNKYERIENLFRDLSSIYFYMFAINNISSLLNRWQDGRDSRIDPVSTEGLHNHIKTAIQDEKGAFIQGGINKDDFRTKVLGNTDKTVTDAIDKKLEKFSFISEEQAEENLSAFDKFKKNIKEQLEKIGLSKKVDAETVKKAKSLETRITLDDFLKQETDTTLRAKATEMAKLQPELDGKYILTKSQVKDIYSEGLINEPSFLKEMYEHITHEHKKPYKSINPYKFVAESDLLSYKQSMIDYVEDIIKKADGKNITEELLKTMKRQNLIKNAINLGAGFAISGYFLSTAIPKVQYWITKKRTGQNKFPGTQEYN